MPFTNTELVSVAADTAGRAGYVTLWLGDPTAAGNGGAEAASVPSTRLAITWGAGTAGQQDQGLSVEIPISGASEYDHVVLVSQESGGTPADIILAYDDVGNTTIGAGGGTVTVTNANITWTTS